VCLFWGYGVQVRKFRKKAFTETGVKLSAKQAKSQYWLSQSGGGEGHILSSQTGSQMQASDSGTIESATRPRGGLGFCWSRLVSPFHRGFLYSCYIR
jgi:hypothetical protein